jgi:hypothetical protein
LWGIVAWAEQSRAVVGSGEQSWVFPMTGRKQKWLQETSVPGNAFWGTGALVETLKRKNIIFMIMFFLLSWMHETSVPGNAFWGTGPLVETLKRKINNNL